MTKKKKKSQRIRGDCVVQGDTAHNSALVSILLGLDANLGTQSSGCGP